MRRGWDDLLELARRVDFEGLRAALSARGEELTALRPPPVATAPYARRVLHASDSGEVMLASWLSGRSSAPHDHGRSRGAVLVLEGCFRERIYRLSGMKLTRVKRRDCARGDLIEVAEATIHDLVARADGLTLHLYTPGIDAMCVYDARSRATLRVAASCGAWVPADGNLILERRSWDGRELGGWSRDVLER
jgi:hypothetical protein